MKLRPCDIVFLAVWGVITVMMGIFMLPALVSRKASQDVAHQWALLTLALVKHISGIASHVRGYQHISKTPVIYAAKHQSAWDTFMLWSVLEAPAFVLKRQLYMIPVFGWYLWRSGQIAINRRDGKHAMESMITQAARYVEQGRSVVIFPEGTRLPPGTPTRYKSGIAYLSAALNVPVVPVALNAGRFWPRHLLKKRSGNAIIEFLPVMPPAGDAKDAWLCDLQERVENAARKLNEQE